MDDSAYLVLITSFDPERKIRGIMRIREVTGFGIAKATSIIENCPSEIMNGMYLTQAKELSDLLKDMGMTVEIQIDEENPPEIKNLDQINFE
jgi:ribosomal protein L7/L12